MRDRGLENKWVRDGDFNLRMKSYYSQRAVRLRYVTPRMMMFKSLNINQNAKGEAVASIQCSPFHRSIFLSCIKEAFGNALLPRFRIEVKIESDFIERFEHFLKCLSSITGQAEIKEQFTLDIIDELKAIITSIQNPNFYLQHKLPVFETESKPYANPSYKKTFQLTHFLDELSFYYDLVPLAYDKMGRYMLHLLSQGEDPDQANEAGETLLSQIVIKFEGCVELMKLCMMYKGNPFLSDRYGMAPYEEACERGYYPAVNYIISNATKVEKPLSVSNPLLSVDLCSSNDRIITAFCFSSDNQNKPSSLIVTLKSSVNLTDEEMQGLEKVFEERCVKNDKGFQSIYAKEPDRFVNVIRQQDGKIVGSVVYEIKMVNGKLWVYIDFAVVSAKIPNFGIMPGIIFGLPVSLQKFFPSTPIWIVFFAADYSSFKLFNDGFAIPRHQPRGKVTEIANTLRKDFGKKFNLFYDNHDGAICYVTEEHPVIVKGKERTTTTDIMEELYWFFLGDKSDKRRDGLSAKAVTSKFVCTQQAIAKSKGLNFIHYTHELGGAISQSEMLSLHLGIKVSQSQSNFQLGFFKESVPYFNEKVFWSDEVELDDSLDIKNKLAELPENRKSMQARK